MLDVQLFDLQSFLPLPYQEALLPRLKGAHEKLQNGSGLGGEFTGWVHLPRTYDRAEFARIQAASRKIQSDSQALVVIGIGGSYLGARGVIDCLCSPNYNLKHKSTPNIYFIGNGLSSDALDEVLELVADVDFSVNVISKSGTTTEPAVAFRFFRDALEKKYGKEGARGRIYATTDRARGALKSLADSEGWETFVVPDDIGGRYSVLTAVGLLPIAAAGVNITALMEGAADMMSRCADTSFGNPAWQYAALRHELYHKGFSVVQLVPQRGTSCTTKAFPWSCWPAMTRPFASWRSGGSNSSARARARTERVCSPPAWNLPPTCTPWANTFRRAAAFSLRPWCASAPRPGSSPSPGTRRTVTG